VQIELMPRPGYLNIVVRSRGGVEDAREALQQIVDAIGEQRRVLVSVHESEAMYKVEAYGLSDALTRLAGVPGLRIALVADTRELFLSYQYVETLAGQRNLAARAFRNEQEALRWLLA
jgi:hypothetical protein